jgi:Cu2+-exporting ATPase
MNITALNDAGSRTAPKVSFEETAHCFHCGDANLAGDTFKVRFDGRTRYLCCAGCAAVAQTIVDAGLGDFYRLREQGSRDDGSAAKSLRPAQLVPDELKELARYNLPAVQDQVTRTHEGLKETDLILEGLTCAACAWLVEHTVARIPGVSGVDVNYTTARASVAWDKRKTSLADILFAIRRVGLEAHPADAQSGAAARKRERRRRLLEFLVAGLGMMQVMMFAVPIYIAEPGDLPQDFENLMRWASLFLLTPVVLYSARSFFANAWRDLKHLRIGMDVPIALAIAVTFLASVHATIQGSGEVYYDSVGMFVFLLLGSRYLEFAARSRAAEAIERLAPPLPALVERLPRHPESSHAESVPVAALAAGDVIRVKTGATVPGDGVILQGMSALDESLLTGESRPVPRKAGDRVVGGSINAVSPLVVRLEEVGDNATLAQISRLARRAAGTRPRAALLSDRVAGAFAAIVLVLAGLTVLYWFPSGGDAWFRHAVAVLVVTCPCALALAIPTALTAAGHRLSRLGLLATRGSALESLARVTDVVFDKTGTLTEPRLAVKRVAVLANATAEECLAAALALEAGFAHPIAQALIAHAAALDVAAAKADAISTASGLGVEARIGGTRYRLGSATFAGAIVLKPLPLKAPAYGLGESHVYLAREGTWLARIDVQAPLRASAVAATGKLRGLGVELHLLSGDLPDAVMNVASAVGIDKAAAQATPQAKLAYVQNLQSQGRHVLMIGDGINDAPVLAASDASIAVADGRSGSDLARAQAALVMLSNDLNRIPDALGIARQARRVMRQNIGWAIAYNALFVPLAMLGILTPWVAALGMSVSSLLVVANAARLARMPRFEE